MKKLYGIEYGTKQAREIAQEYKTNILEWLSPQKDDVILEIGFGSGDILKFLESYSSHVFGADINDEYLVHLKKPRTFASDARSLAVGEETVDKSISLHALEHIKELQSVFQELDRVTKPGGLSLHAFPAPGWFPFARLAGADYDARQLTKNPLRILKIANQLHPHKLDRKKIEQFLQGTHWKIVRFEKMFVPSERGSAWIMLLKKEA